MKSKIDLSEADTFDVVIGLLSLLVDFKIESADDLNDEAHIDHTCGVCEKHTSDCSCDDDGYSRGYEYDDEAAFED